ncbi:hypothetical protein ACFRAO_43500 [Streptomyces sp. NPDC056656]|uniref:hypothetical protein n=1 Tax=Streptomyces sp. NPDC056656 TaxID=3345895 RepID=UPI0036A5EE8C
MRVERVRVAGGVVRVVARTRVNPLAEKRTRHSADIDTADLCWSTVNAVLNDLAASKTP